MRSDWLKWFQSTLINKNIDLTNLKNKLRQFWRVDTFVVWRWSVVPSNVATINRIPLQAVTLGLVSRRQKHGHDPATLDESEKEAPVVVGRKIERVLVDLTQWLKSLRLVLLKQVLDNVDFNDYSFLPKRSKNHCNRGFLFGTTKRSSINDVKILFTDDHRWLIIVRNC